MIVYRLNMLYNNLNNSFLLRSMSNFLDLFRASALTTMIFLLSLTSVHAAGTEELTYTLPNIPSDGFLLSRQEMLLGFQKYFSITEDDSIKLARKTDTFYFKDVWPASDLYVPTAYLCIHEILTCGKDISFRADESASIESVWKLYYELRYIADGAGAIPKKYGNPSPWYFAYKVEAMKEGIAGAERAPGTVSHRDFLYVLKADSTLRSFGWQVKFFPGLELSSEELKIYNFQDDAALEAMLSRYKEAFHEKTLVATSVKNILQERIDVLEALLKKRKENPLQQDSAYTAEWKKKFQEVGVREELGYGEYRFRTNASYRKHNILAALGKMHGLVLQPDEEFNYWDILKKKGMSDIVSGWTLNGGEEVWEWGGGLCGSATALFRSAWFSGLEITERRQHSAYYTSFYAMKDIGLDAALYLSSPNLRFKNNTGKPLMFYVSYTEEPGYGTVQIHMLGTKHFKDMSFSDVRKEKGVYIRDRVITLKDGTEDVDTVRSSYGKIK